VAGEPFEKNVFINCPFDAAYSPLLEALLFCVVRFGYSPRLATESLEAGENRLDKIVWMIKASKYSIHDLSRCKASCDGDIFRMNMPFEYGIDFGLRHSGVDELIEKKFLIFEESQYDLKTALSDIAGQDIEHHDCEYESVMRKVRDFFRVEAGIEVPGAARLISEYVTFQGWMTEKKISEGHSEADAINLPTRERLDEMKLWNRIGRPSEFIAN